METPIQKRPIDKLAEESSSWLKRKYVFIEKKKVKTWKAIFIIAFFAGLASAFVWGVSEEIFSNSKASGGTTPTTSANQTSSTIKTIQWGAKEDIPVSGDFDYDGKIDIAVWRPSEGNWYIINSSDKKTQVIQWGTKGDIPVPADYDNDKKIDLAVWRPSEGNWYIVNSSDKKTQVTQWGTKGDIPVPADYDNDKKTDIAVWRPSEGNWYIINSSDKKKQTIQWGIKGDVPTPGDYDNDQKTDIAVWRPSDGNWYIINSSDKKNQVIQWGMKGDILVPADFDGDKKIDIAVWRPSDGNWYIIKSTSGKKLIFQLGAKNDIPVPADYDGDQKSDIVTWSPSNGNWSITPAPNCTSICTSGTKQCLGNGYQTCADSDKDGCFEWSVTTNCPSGQTCSEGSCAVGFHVTSTKNFSKRIDCAPNGVCGTTSGVGYAYAPADIHYQDVSHLFFCSAGMSGKSMDDIRYINSKDAVLQNILSLPGFAGNGSDLAACDPEVVLFKGYFYMFYGSTLAINPQETDKAKWQKINTIHLARSQKISGPYKILAEDGTWQALPTTAKQLIPPKVISMSRTQSKGYMGASWPSVVARGGKLLIWYSDDTGLDLSSGAVNNTHPYFYLETTDPSKIDIKQAVPVDIADDVHSGEVKFDPESNLFVMFSVYVPHSPSVWLGTRYSSDGIHWSQAEKVIALPAYSHNVGVGSDELGNLPAKSFNFNFAAPVGLVNNLSWGYWDLYSGTLTKGGK